MSYSIVIPMLETIHINGFHICGVSKKCSRTIYIHHNQSGKILGRTVKNEFGEPNHYGKRGEIAGYSRNKSRSKIIHYNSVGKPVGYSRRLLWLLWVHFGKNQGKNMIFKLW